MIILRQEYDLLKQKCDIIQTKIYDIIQAKHVL